MTRVRRLAMTTRGSRAEVSDFSPFSPSKSYHDIVRERFIVRGGKKFKFENKVIVVCFLKKLPSVTTLKRFFLLILLLLYGIVLFVSFSSISSYALLFSFRCLAE